MINPNHQTPGGGKTEVFKGAFHIPDFENPAHHDGDLVHYSHMITTATGMDLLPRFGGRAFNEVYSYAVNAHDHRKGSGSFDLPLGYIPSVRDIDWRFNRLSQHPDHLTKRLRLFLTNELVADTFYDHLVPESSDWPSLHLDVIEALLKARGHDRPSEKREAHAARRLELLELS